MNYYPQDLQTTVYKVLSENRQSRNSDIELYKIILTKFYGTTDISKINLSGGDIFSSIKRCRQKIQAENPFLAADKQVKEYRNNNQEKYLNYVRNY